MAQSYSSKSLCSWAFYDFANTIFSAIVLTAYFPLYITALTGQNSLLGFATTGSMVLAGLVIPFLGALSDQTGGTKKYLILFTLACIGCLLFISFSRQAFPLLLFFSLSCFFYHGSLVFYNSLLPVVAPQEKQGFASGLGTGLGYLGVVFALPIANVIDKKFGTPPVFTVAAALFLIFSLPLFFFVPERRVDHPIPFKWSLWRSEWVKVMGLVRALPSQPKLLLFFGGNFFIVDALNTLILWFSVFARAVFHATQGQIIFLLIGINASAFAGGIVSGFVTDRLGAMRTFICAALLLSLSTIALALMPDFRSFVVIALSGGALSIAAIWTSSRKALVELAPEDKVGEYFGLYGLTTKISIIGNLLFGIIADAAGFRTALCTLVFPATVGMAFLFWGARIRKQ